jgi:hypothetical protein
LPVFLIIIQYGIRGFGKFIEESLTEKQREDTLYLVAGQCHPEFMNADGGQEYKRYQEVLTPICQVAAGMMHVISVNSRDNFFV